MIVQHKEYEVPYEPVLKNQEHELFSRTFPFQYIEYENEQIAKEDLSKEVLVGLLKKIQKQELTELFVVIDEEKEMFMSLDFNKNWAVFLLATPNDPTWITSFNPKYQDVDELSVVQIGHQSPILKHFSFDDIDLILKSVVYYLKFERFCPDADWAIVKY